MYQIIKYKKITIKINHQKSKEEPIITQKLSVLLNNNKNNIIKEYKDKMRMLEIIMQKNK